MDEGSPPTTDSTVIQDSNFPETRWSLIVRAKGDNEPDAEGALEELCSIYWYPIYAYLRRIGQSAHDAEDLTQAFFAKILSQQPFGSVDASKGRLRSYLLTSVKNFQINAHSHDTAERRGGMERPLSIDQAEAENRYQFEPADELTPDKIFDRRWAITILEQVLLRLEQSYSSKGRQAQFDALRPFLEWRGTGADSTYADAAAQIGKTTNNFKQMVHRFRKTYQTILRDEVLQTVGKEEEVEDELNRLLQALS